MKNISKHADYVLRKMVRAINKRFGNPQWISFYYDEMTAPERQAMMLSDILEEKVKGALGWRGGTVEEMEKAGYELDNYFEVRAGLKGTSMECTAHGLDAVTSLFSYTGTNDLDTAIVYDFNKLVAAIYRAYKESKAS